ncbi:hypothetical protein, partial [Actinopolymorpha pittospori]|uniref:hypothetical protein n=1 Tax=Actinopolymorpha pittospori TaxID=648752 RepID=UPI0031E9CCBE
GGWVGGCDVLLEVCSRRRAHGDGAPEPARRHRAALGRLGSPWQTIAVLTRGQQLAPLPSG